MAIFILGMHRSGTSAITSLIESMGAYVGKPDELLANTPDNPHGFFERKDILAANQRVMKWQGCNWFTVGGFDARRPLPAMCHQPVAECVARLTLHPIFAAKDPRFCLTLPYWLPLLPHPPLIILAIRHPASIAQSLHTRNQLPIAHGLGLWEAYMQAALANIRGMTVLPVAYEALMANPQQQAEALYQALRQHFSLLTRPDSARLVPSLSHSTPANIALTKSQSGLYEKFSGLI